MAYRTASPPSLHLSLGALTDVGEQREHNEDDFLVFECARAVRLATAPAFGDFDSHRGFGLVVIDGMGGHSSGYRATELAAEVLHERLAAEAPAPGPGEAWPQRLGEALSAASAAIHDASVNDRSFAGMGASATVAIVEGDRLHLGQVGDTQAFVLRRGRLVQVTKEHSLINEVLEQKIDLTEEQIRELPRNVITRALGMSREVNAWHATLALRAGDTLLLCSDGLSGMLPDEEMERMLVALPHPAEAVRALVNAANRAGGADNITAIVARFDGDGLRPPREDDALEDPNPRWHRGR